MSILAEINAAEQFLAFFSSQGAEMVDVAVLQPADPFLDIVGEDLRRRIFMTEDEAGASLCLRPEFTLPVCIHYLSQAKKGPRRLAYYGQVFRQHRQTNPGFVQAGIEDLGDDDEAASDARSLRDAMLALNGEDLEVTLGDQAVFETVLVALGLPQGWRRKLVRCFGDRHQVLERLHELAEVRVTQWVAPSLIEDLKKENVDALAGAIAEEMRCADISPTSGRTPLEIARRLLEKQSLSRLYLQSDQLAALREFLSIRVELSLAERQLAQFAEKNRLNMNPALEQFAQRNRALGKIGLKLSDISYDAAFGRKLDYYSGLIYEIRHHGQMIAGGGRYNHLMTMLGATEPIPAVGFSIWVDRLIPWSGRLNAKGGRV